MEIPLSDKMSFSELPLNQYKTADSRIYILDSDGVILFVNQTVTSQLNLSADQFMGKSIWEIFPSLALDPDFQLLRRNVENNRFGQIITTSPVTGTRVSIVGYALKDCYFFSASMLMNKSDLINDLKRSLGKG
jgi:PAS domain-containing protein